MIMGIDVGGTHTDGVLLQVQKDGNFDKKVMKITDTVKVPTQAENLNKSVLKVLDILLQKRKKNKIKAGIERIVLSTTLAANTIVEEKYDPVGLILIPGPGLNPDYYKYGEVNFTASGYIDHRGQVVEALKRSEIIKALEKMKAQGIKDVAVVGKFSIRNPVQEEKIKKIIKEEDYKFRTITLGHRLSGSLNFPRRVVTAYYNTAVAPIHHEFKKAVIKSLNSRNIDTEVMLLKCDGGTIPLNKSEEIPVKTVNSGPAASIMGTRALSKKDGTGLALDIGGTTTDISLFIQGEPAFKPKGIELQGLPTLIRGLYSYSVGVGGDSQISVKEGQLQIGPRREGPAAACGGPAPTPTDALLVLGKIEENKYYNNNFDIKAARNSLKKLAQDLDWKIYQNQIQNQIKEQDDKEDIELISKIILDRFLEILTGALDRILKEFNHQPVYTISELLSDTRITPDFLTGMGGPARTLIPLLGKKLDLETEVVPYSAVANAVGAASSRVTLETTLRADTARGKLNIVEAGVQKQIEDKEKFDLEKAENLARKWTLKRLKTQENYPVEITHSESFNVIRGFRTLGKIIEVKAQIQPGQIAPIKRGDKI